MYVKVMYGDRYPKMTPDVITDVDIDSGTIDVAIMDTSVSLRVPRSWFDTGKLLFFGSVQVSHTISRVDAVRHENAARLAQEAALRGESGGGLRVDSSGRIRGKRPKSTGRPSSSGLDQHDAALQAMGNSVVVEKPLEERNDRARDSEEHDYLDSDSDSGGGNEPACPAHVSVANSAGIADKLISQIGAIVPLIESLEQDMKLLRLPLESLVGTQHARYLEKGSLRYDNADISVHAKGLRNAVGSGVSPEIGQKVIDALTLASAVFGKLQSHVLRSHAQAAVCLISELSADQSETALYDAAHIGTVFVASCLQPLIALLKELTAPAAEQPDPTKREERL